MIKNTKSLTDLTNDQTTKSSKKKSYFQSIVSFFSKASSSGTKQKDSTSTAPSHKVERRRDTASSLEIDAPGLKQLDEKSNGESASNGSSSDANKSYLSTPRSRLAEKPTTYVPTVLKRCSSSTAIAQKPQSQSIYIGKRLLSIIEGDLTKQTVDAIIVVSTSDQLTRSILDEAGPSVRTEYEREKGRRRGDSIQTGGGKLSCKRIYFIPCPNLKKNADKWVFRSFIFEAMTLAMNEKTCHIRSMALPAVGCGLINCDPDFVAKILIMAILYELEQRPTFEISVSFVIQENKPALLNQFITQLQVITANQPYTISDPLVAPEAKLPPQIPKTNHKHRTFEVEKRFLADFSEEYVQVVKLFEETMTKQMFNQIIRIELVWNYRWHQQYQIHHEEFRRRLGDDVEKWLFHGCSQEAAAGIIKRYFDRSYAGAHGVSYGQGVYFSSKASYSHGFTQPNRQGERCMFLAKVLIGKSIQGDSSMKTCPEGYDTTTDGSHIYVTYSDSQAFGKYLITYK